jgi:hypothetical protein
MFPRITQRQWTSLSIGVGSFVFFASLWKYYTAASYHETDVQRGSPLPKTLPSNYGQLQLEGESVENHDGFRTTRPIRSNRIWP